MATDDSAENGTFEGAHGAEKISVDAARAAKVGIVQAEAEAAMAGFLGELQQPEAEQAELALDEDCLFSGPVDHVAKTIEGARGRGRPKGSQNKNSWRDTMLRMGYRHPGENLLRIANADPIKLAEELSQPYTAGKGPKEGKLVEASMTPAEALGLILKANAELLPYFEGKAAQEINHNIKALGVMVIGDMRTETKSDGGMISLTDVEKPE